MDLNGSAKFRRKKKHDSEACVLSIKVVSALLGLARERPDPYRSPRLRTKVSGTNPARLAFAMPAHNFEGHNFAQKRK